MEGNDRPRRNDRVSRKNVKNRREMLDIPKTGLFGINRHPGVEMVFAGICREDLRNRGTEDLIRFSIIELIYR